MNTSRITLNIQTSSKTGKSLEGYFSSNYLKKLENELMISEKMTHFINGTIMFYRNYPTISLNLVPLSIGGPSPSAISGNKIQKRLGSGFRFQKCAW